MRVFQQVRFETGDVLRPSMQNSTDPHVAAVQRKFAVPRDLLVALSPVVEAAVAGCFNVSACRSSSQTTWSPFPSLGPSGGRAEAGVLKPTRDQLANDQRNLVIVAEPALGQPSLSGPTWQAPLIIL